MTASDILESQIDRMTQEIDRQSREITRLRDGIASLRDAVRDWRNDAQLVGELESILDPGTAARGETPLLDVE